MTLLVRLGGMNDVTYSIEPGPVDPELAGIMTTHAPVGTAALIAAYRQIIERAHAHGVAVFGATLTPIGGSGASTPAGEAARQHVNDWIRGSGAFDAVLDFDAVWRDPEDPTAWRPVSTSVTTCTATTPATERWRIRSTSGCSTDRSGSRAGRAVRSPRRPPADGAGG